MRKKTQQHQIKNEKNVKRAEEHSLISVTLYFKNKKAKNTFQLFCDLQSRSAKNSQTGTHYIDLRDFSEVEKHKN